MAAGDATPFPIKNQAYRVTFPILDADGDLVAGAADLDSEVSKDGGTFADCDSEATEIATNSGVYYLDLTATEMNADTVAIIVKTSTAGAKTTPIVLYPVEGGDIPVNLTQWKGAAPSDLFEGNVLTNLIKWRNSAPAGLYANRVQVEVIGWAASGTPDALASGKVQTKPDNLGTQAKADVNAEADQALVDYDGPTYAEMLAALAALNDLSAAEVNAQVDAALADVRLDELVAATAGAVDPAVGSIMDLVMNKNGSQTFDPATDSLEALRDTGGIGGPTADQVAAAVWDELQVDHVITGSFGRYLDDEISEVPGAVWEESHVEHMRPSTFGGRLDMPISKVPGAERQRRGD